MIQYSILRHMFYVSVKGLLDFVSQLLRSGGVSLIGQSGLKRIVTQRFSWTGCFEEECPEFVFQIAKEFVLICAPSG